MISPNLQKYVQQSPVLYIDKEALEGVFKAVKRPQVLVLSTHGFFLDDNRQDKTIGCRHRPRRVLWP